MVETTYILKTNRRPIVFVGHSLGGLLIKEVSPTLPKSLLQEIQFEMLHLSDPVHVFIGGIDNEAKKYKQLPYVIDSL